VSDKAKAQEKRTSAEFSLKTLMKTNIEIRVLLTNQATNGTSKWVNICYAAAKKSGISSLLPQKCRTEFNPLHILIKYSPLPFPIASSPASTQQIYLKMDTPSLLNFLSFCFHRLCLMWYFSFQGLIISSVKVVLMAYTLVTILSWLGWKEDILKWT